MIVNAVLASRAFDPYPFILLNLVLSCVAAIQAPPIMIEDHCDINVRLARQSALESGDAPEKKQR